MLSILPIYLTAHLCRRLELIVNIPGAVDPIVQINPGCKAGIVGGEIFTDDEGFPQLGKGRVEDEDGRAIFDQDLLRLQEEIVACGGITEFGIGLAQ